MLKAGENSCAIQYWIHPTPRMPVQKEIAGVANNTQYALQVN